MDNLFVEYPKIETLLDRDEHFKVILGKWRTPDFDYLKNNTWEWTEKVDGTNIRVMWDKEQVKFGGRTDNASIPAFLLRRLETLFPMDKFKELYPETSLCLYGEGYGAKIQGGGKYKQDGVDFVLFDILINGYWLERENIEGIASKLSTEVVPRRGSGTLLEAIEYAKTDFKSIWGSFPAEGLVVKPLTGLFSRNGERIIGKIKRKDFNEG